MINEEITFCALTIYLAAEWCGKKEGSRQVQVKLGPGKKIRITNERGNKILRTVDLTHYTKVSIAILTPLPSLSTLLPNLTALR